MTCLFWLSLWNAVRIDWETNNQYSYGWSVPFIAAALFLKCWRDRPASSLIPPWQHRVLCALIFMLALLQFPFGLVEEANAEWRFLFWCRECQCVLLTLAVIALAGGWHRVRHLSFPVLLTATAVPWSRFIEEPLIQQMMRMVARISVEGLFLWHIPAIQKGNLIQLADGIVGIGEACSGMRSVQTSLMLALVGGEYWRLSVRNRWLTALLGVFIALILNTIRTFSLSALAALSGFSALQRWHDAAGMIEMGLGIIAVLMLARFLRSNDSVGALLQLESLGKTDTSPKVPAPGARELCPDERKAIPAWLLICLAVIWLGAALATQAWYNLHGPDIEPQWTLAVPRPGMKGFDCFTTLKVPEDQQAQLRTNDCLAFSWKDPDGASWSLSFFRWPSGRSSEAVVTVHRPGFCLPAAGYELVRECDPVDIEVDPGIQARG